MDAGGFAGLGIDGDFTDYRVGAQRQVAGVVGRIDQAGGGIESGVNVASALAFAGSSSITAAAILIVLEAVGGDSGAVLGKDATHLLQALLQRDFGAV